MRLPSATALALQPAATSHERVRTAARELESQFAQVMIKSMRGAGFGDPFGGDSSYRDMYDQQLAKTLTQGRGLGLAPMIERQLLRSLPGATPPATGGAPLPLTLPDPGGFGLAGIAPPAGPAAPALAPSSSGVSMRAMAPVALPPAPAEHGASPGRAKAAPACDPQADLDCSSPEAFVRSIWPHAQETARKLGVSPRALVAQAALETGWGRHLVGGEQSHNLFGIKAGRSWHGARVESGTHEFVDGRRVETRAGFRAYGSVHDSFADYARLMRNDRYAGALAAGDDPARFAGALQRAGYATDPAYAAKISAIANGPTLDRALAALPDTTTRG